MGVIKIKKNEARRWFNAGEPVFIQSCKLPFDCTWHNAVKVSNDDASYDGYDFDTIVSFFEAFNCDGIRGRYASFYLKT